MLCAKKILKKQNNYTKNLSTQKHQLNTTNLLECKQST